MLVVSSKVVLHIRYPCLYKRFAYAALSLGLIDQVKLATLNLFKGTREL